MEEAKWYVAHTFSGYENKVASNIETVVENRNLHDWIQDVVVPTETVAEIKDDGTKKEVERKIFPGYVLIKMVMNDDSWYVVRNTRGVTSFVGPGSKPVPLTDKEVAALGMEKLEVKGGRFKQKSMSDYVIPTSMDFPKQFYHIQENPYPWGPYGAKGMGELVFNGASAAYVDAVERALNTRFTSIPIPPEAIEEAMKHVH